MALRGLKITWVCIASLFISCSIIYNLNLKIVHFCYFQNTFPFVSTFRQTDDIRKKCRTFFVEQGIVTAGFGVILILPAVTSSLSNESKLVS